MVLHCAFLFPMPGEIVSSSGSIAAGKAAGCTVISSNSSFKKLQLEFDRFPVPKQLSWVSLQRAEDACCAGRGMLVTKADTKGQISVLLRVALLKSMGPAASQGTVCSDAGCHLSQQVSSVWCQQLCARCGIFRLQYLAWLHC